MRKNPGFDKEFPERSIYQGSTAVGFPASPARAPAPSPETGACPTHRATPRSCTLQDARLEHRPERSGL